MVEHMYYLAVGFLSFVYLFEKLIFHPSMPEPLFTVLSSRDKGLACAHHFMFFCFIQ
jgi:hypothetical protein